MLDFNSIALLLFFSEAVPKESIASTAIEPRPSPSLKPNHGVVDVLKSESGVQSYPPPFQQYPAVVSHPPSQQPYEPPSYSPAKEHDAVDALDIFIILGTLILALGTIASMFFVAIVLLKRGRRRGPAGERRSSAKYTPPGVSNSVMMVSVDDSNHEDLYDEDDDSTKYKGGTTLSDNDDTLDEELNEEACRLTEGSRTSGSNFSLIENSPSYIRGHFAMDSSEVDIFRVSSSVNMTAVTDTSKHDMLRAAVDSTFAAADEAGNFFGSQQELRNLPRATAMAQGRSRFYLLLIIAI